jgi:hypothetical protein
MNEMELKAGRVRLEHWLLGALATYTPIPRAITQPCEASVSEFLIELTVVANSRASEDATISVIYPNH